MTRRRVIVFVGCMLLAACFAQETTRASSAAENEPHAVLEPSVAGLFYPANAQTLEANVERYLQEAVVPEIDGEIVAAIVPHAGHVYSGPVAAYAYKALGRQERERADAGGKKVDAVVLLAFSHRSNYPNVSVYYTGAIETPLGRTAVNEAVAKEFMSADPRLSFSQGIFAGEHSAEVQVPFLQTVLPETPLVPVMMGWQGRENIDAVVRGLAKVAENNRVVVVATTDLSHYQPYDKAGAFDRKTVDMILMCDSQKFFAYASEHTDAMCGVGTVLAAVSFAERQGAKPVLLKYANSGDTAGTKNAVVGYAAIVFVKKDEPEKEAKPDSTGSENATVQSEGEYLSDDDKKTLLALARESVESIVRTKKMLRPQEPESARLKEKGAAFVTLRKEGHLRGCIGSMQPMEPLYSTVVHMAAAAATEDPRFSPLRAEELDDIHIEISVNTPLRRVSSPDEIVLGKHGVVVSKGSRQGVFLPQVATETGWTKEELLGNLCAHKAGLPPDAYKNDAALFVFTSIIFEEEN